MPLQNRVTPTGEIIATPHRGLFTGNRGIIHDPATRTLLARRWANKAWLTCLCEFKGRRREVMGGRSWTELFFLDEATAFAAGHRPCFFCRRDDANRFRAAWEQGNGVTNVLARDIDAVLHRERLGSPARSGCIRCRCPSKNCPMARWCRRNGELSDRAGPGAIVVAGRLSQGAGARDQGRHAADAALDAARVVGGISAGAASERRTCRLTSAAAGRARRRSSAHRATPIRERFAGNAAVPRRPLTPAAPAPCADCAARSIKA